MKKKFLSILAAFAVLVSFSACQAGDTGQAPPLSEAVVSEATKVEVTTQVTETSLNCTNCSQKTFASRDYELDLKNHMESNTSDKYSLQEELFFLNEEQYETYLRALIFVDEIEYYYITNTNGISHWLDENGKTYDNYYYINSDGITVMVPYFYISNYNSFYEYLQSIFTDNAINEIMNNDRFYNVDGELYFKSGEKGGPIYFQDGQYSLVKSNEHEVVFEYLAHQYDGKNNWTETHTIKLVYTSNGWRSEIFDYLYAESN